jgi:hypothetical protein
MKKAENLVSILLPPDFAARALESLIAKNNALIVKLQNENAEYKVQIDKFLGRTSDLIDQMSQKRVYKKRGRSTRIFNDTPTMQEMICEAMIESDKWLTVAEISNSIVERYPNLLNEKGMEIDRLRRNLSSVISQKIKKGLIFIAQEVNGKNLYGLIEWKDKKAAGTLYVTAAQI